MSTNIGYWEQILQAPTPAYAELFKAESEYLQKNIKSEDSVLDVGCGEGRNVKTIFAIAKNVTGVDNDEIAVKDALNNFIENPTVKIVKGEAVALPFADNSFDVVTFLMILPNLDAFKIKAFSEVARVLKSGGVMLLSTFAETAFDERIAIYKQVGSPIVRIEGTKVIFDKSLGANISEQFSLEEIKAMASATGFVFVDAKKVGTLAYLCKFLKP
jgi:ubiquinone/menaquinone biosynthesis C-methylase UbiE